ncbi:Hsp70 family protein [Methylovirgula sp. 4M-Z18]|uniref:Hsp70 family protein n=1 Tax=Methylovirgula sp. 4M-Z18 TaxID=2293567 RepID=UPI000E2E6C97|nr:Hsp70 family protein [Methylovirgula sp. 4M-Z18]RFB78497.1 Hsp70 family protein [Methylovirgula sp. 4M-Z18]
MTLAIGIDFGTTNSVVAVAQANGEVKSFTWPADGGPTDTFRTALAFWQIGRPLRASLGHCAGPAALAKALDAAQDHRFVQSIKTYLASAAFSETRLYGTKLTIEEIVSLFFAHLLSDHGGAAAFADTPAVAGRPVVFAGDTADEELAVARLRRAYDQAGLPKVTLAYEPLGAAYWYARALKRDETVLVADFGGGTSDFSVMRFSHAGGKLQAQALAHSGVGIAGDTFDYRLVDHVVSPHLGKGSFYRSHDKRLPMPAYFHAAFAQWHRLSWLKTPQTRSELQKLIRDSDVPEQLQDLWHFIEMDLGFELYQAVGNVKAQLSAAPKAQLHFDREGIRIDATVTRQDFETWIAADLAAVEGAMEEALRQAGIGDGDVDAVFMTGGTSYVPAVRRIFAERFGEAKMHLGHAFQSVASGLALIAADRRVDQQTAVA